MARNLSHDLKRIVAGLCAVLVIGGTVSVQPIAELFNTAVVASAEAETDLTIAAPAADGADDSSEYGKVTRTTTNGNTTFKAEVKDGYYFVGWTYDGSDGEVTVDTLVWFTANIPANLTAHFVKIIDISETDVAPSIAAVNVTYTKEAQSPVIKLGDTKLIEGSDYRITSVNNNTSLKKGTDIGEYSVSIEGIGKYTGSTVVSWGITAPEVTADNIILGWYDEETNTASNSSRYNAEIQIPDFYFKTTNGDGKDKFVKLAEGTDYQFVLYENGFKFTDHKEATNSPLKESTYYCKIIGKEDSKFDLSAFAGSELPFTIANANPVANKLTYTGEPQELTCEGLSSKGIIKFAQSDEEGEIIGWSTEIPKGTNAGTYAVGYAIFENAEAVFPKTMPKFITVTIKPLTITDDNIAVGTYDAEKDEFTDGVEYAGTERTPNVYYREVVDASAETPVYIYTELAASTDYEIEHADGTDLITIGEKTLTVKGAGNFTGSIVKKWNITKATIPAEAVTAPVAQTIKYTGEETPVLTDANKGSVDAKYGTLEYCIGGANAPGDNVTWNSDIPVSNNTGNINVWYRVNGNDLYKTSEPQKIVVSVVLAETTVTLINIGAGLQNIVNGSLSGSPPVLYRSENSVTYKVTATQEYFLGTSRPIEGASEEGSIARYENWYGNIRYYVTIPANPKDGGYVLNVGDYARETYINDDNDSVYVKDSTNNTAKVASFNTENVYFYGAYPTAEDVVINKEMYAEVRLKEFYFTEPEKTDKLEGADLKTGNSYVVNAVITVILPGQVEKEFTIKDTIQYDARPMNQNKYYLVDGENETELDIEDGAVIVPKDTFTYSDEEYAPVIKVVNGDDAEMELTVDEDYTDNTAGFIGGGDYTAELKAVEGSNYTGKVALKWGIAKKYAPLAIAPADKITYDGKPLDVTDFVFTDEENILESPGAKITVTGVGKSDITSAGEQMVRVTVTTDNYEDVVFNIPLTIAKRHVIVTPEEDQSIIYGDEEDPVIKVATEKAIDENDDDIWDSNTGVVPTDVETVDFSDAVSLVDFDYRFNQNDVGVYEYQVSDKVPSNYDVELAGDAYFTIKPKQLTEDMFTVYQDQVTKLFDGEMKYAPDYTFNDGIFMNGHKKLTDSDFEVGGANHAALPGKYVMEFYGQGNYTGKVYFDWEILPIEKYAVSVKFDSKTYDGKPVEPTVDIHETDDSNKTPVDIPGAKTTCTYYEYDGESEITKDYIATLTPLDGAPKDAGKYIVEAETTAKGYDFKDSSKTYTNYEIKQKEIAVIPKSSSKLVGEGSPDYKAYTYDEKAVVDGDTIKITGEYGLENYADKIGKYKFTLGTLEVDNDNYVLTISGAYAVTAIELTDDSIKIIKDCVIGDDGWAYPGDAVNIVADVDGKEVELARPVYDFNSDSYKGTDFVFVSAMRTKKTGDFVVQIKGVGKYTGFAEKTIKINNPDYDARMAAEDGVKIDLADAVLKDNTKARFVLTPTLVDGWEVESYGIVYDKNGTITNAEEAKAGLVLGGDYVTKISKMHDGTSYNLNITPVGNKTVWAVGYITVKKDDMTATIYTEPKSGNVAEMQIDANASLDLADAVLKNGTKARFVMTPKVPEGYTIKSYGIVYDKTGAITNEEQAKRGLILNGEYVAKTSKLTDGTAYALNITPLDGNKDIGIWAVGYVTVTKDGITKTLYTEPKTTSVAELRAPVEDEIAQNAKVELADAALKDGTKARFVLTPEIAEGWTVDAYGIVYDKTGAVKTAEEAKSGLVLNGKYATKTSKLTDGTSYKLNITPVDDNTIWAVGYITATKDGVTTTIYTEPKSANVGDMREPFEQEIAENVKITLSDPMLKDGTKARYVLTPEIAEGWTVDAYGIVYDKTGAVKTEEEAKNGLVLDGSFATKISKMTDGTPYALNITPIEDTTPAETTGEETTEAQPKKDYTIWAVGYITVTKGDITKTIYTDPKSINVAERIQAIEADMKSSINLNLGIGDSAEANSKKLTLTPTVPDKFKIETYGIIYDNNTEFKDTVVTTGEGADAVTKVTETAVEKAQKKLVLGNDYYANYSTSTSSGTPLSADVKVNGNKPIWAVGYITITVEGYTKTIYTKPVTTAQQS